MCRAIKAKGVADVNPSNPALLEYIAKGVTVEVFEAAAETCAKATPPKGMAYLLGIVKRQMTEAAGIASGVGMPAKPWDDKGMHRLRRSAAGGTRHSSGCAPIGAIWSTGCNSPAQKNAQQHNGRWIGTRMM